MGRVTRKGLLQGSAAGVLVAAGVRPATAGAAPLRTDERADVAHRGRALAVTPRGTHVVTAHAARRTLAIRDRRRNRTRVVRLGGQPLELAIAPGGALLAATTAFWDEPGVELIAVRTGARRTRLAAGSSPLAVAFTPDGDHLFVAGGEDDGTLRILRGPAFGAGRTVEVGAIPRGLAVGAEHAWVALHGEGHVARVALRSGRVERRFAVPALPDRVALSRDGRTLLISHGGHDAHALTELDTRTGRTRRRNAGGVVTAVAWGAGGRRLAALHREDAIAVIDVRGRRRILPTVAGPRGLAVAGRHVFTTSSADGRTGRIRV